MNTSTNPYVGHRYAAESRQQGRPGDMWFLDEVFITINDERHHITCGGLSIRKALC